MASKLKLKNTNGKTLVIENSDDNLNDVSIKGHSLITKVKDREELRALIGYEGQVVTQIDIALSYEWDVQVSIDDDNGGTIIHVSSAGGWRAKYSGSVNVKWFGAKGDGVTNNSQSFRDAISYCNSKKKTLYIPDSNNPYILKATLNGENLLGNIECSIIGQSKQNSKVYFQELSADSIVQGFTINADDISISDIFMRIESTSSSSVLCVIQRANGLHIKNNRFETLGTKEAIHNGVTVQEHQAHIFKVSDDCIADNVNILGNEFKKFRYGIFSSNTFGANGNIGHAYYWNISSNHFSDTSVEALEFNSNDGEATPAIQPWRYINVVGNTFDNKIDMFTSIIVGADNASHLNITDNIFANIRGDVTHQSSPLHIENCTGNININGNMFTGCHRGIEVAHTVSGDYTMVISANTIRGNHNYNTSTDVSTFVSSNVLSVGIDLLIDSAGSPDGVLVSGNTVSQLETGIKVGNSSKMCIVTNNVVNLCINGFDVPNYFNSQLEDNMVHNTKYVYYPRGTYGFIGHNKAFNCYMLFNPDVARAGYFAVNGLDWTLDRDESLPLPVIPSDVTTAVPIFEEPVRLDCSPNVSCGLDSYKTTNFDVAKLVLDYDGTTFTGTKGRNMSSGSFSVHSTVGEISGGAFNLKFYQAIGTDQKVFVKFSSDGLIIF